ncbi:MAG: dethiobiotin synthase [Desulfovibrionales bacterium]
MIRLFITATDTGAGKTVFAGLLCRYFLDLDQTVRYIKPVQTGHPPDDDAAEVRKRSGLPLERTQTLFTGKEPVAPCFLFDPFPYDQVVQRINAVSDCDVLVVEGAGGLLVPLDSRRQMFELIRDCRLHPLVVVPNRLGCLNHAQLNDRFLNSEGLPLHGFVVNNHFAVDSHFQEQNFKMLQKLLPGKIHAVFDRELELLGNGWE